MIWLPIAMAAAGAAKGMLDEKAAAKKRAAEGQIAQWSPWTGMQAQRVDNGPGVLGGAMQGGLAGASLMQAMGGSGGSKPVGNISDATPGYNPSSSGTGTAVPSAAPSTSVAQVPQSGMSLWGASAPAPAGYESPWMYQNKYSLYAPSNDGTMIAQK